MSALPTIVLLQIPRHHERNDESKIFRKTYTVYEVEFQLELGTHSCIYKRYREFRELRNEAKNLDVHLASFPEKKWFGKLRSGVVERRRVMLESWLQSFMRNRKTIPLLLRFLQAFTSTALGSPYMTVAAVIMGTENPETLPQTVHGLVELASRPASAVEAISTLKSLLTNEDFQVRKTSVREFLSQSVVSWQQMHLHAHMRNSSSRSDAFHIFKVISDSGQFESSQLTNILHEDEDAYRLFVAWEEGSVGEEEPIAGLKWKPLSCGRDDLEVEFRVSEQMMEMRVRMWVTASVQSIVQAVTDCNARKRWDERIEDVYVIRDDGSQSVVHYDLLMSEEHFSLDLLCNVKTQGDTAEIRYDFLDNGEVVRLHSLYQVSPARRGKLRHSASTGDASFPFETYKIEYSVQYTETATRLVLNDLLGSQTYFLQMWDNLKEFLELGYSSRRCSEALPPRHRTMSHRSVAVSQGILRQLICSL